MNSRRRKQMNNKLLLNVGILGVLGLLSLGCGDKNKGAPGDLHAEPEGTAVQPQLPDTPSSLGSPDESKAPQAKQETVFAECKDLKDDCTGACILNAKKECVNKQQVSPCDKKTRKTCSDKNCGFDTRLEASKACHPLDKVCKLVMPSELQNFCNTDHAATCATPVLGVALCTHQAEVQKDCIAGPMLKSLATSVRVKNVNGYKCSDFGLRDSINAKISAFARVSTIADGVVSPGYKTTADVGGGLVHHYSGRCVYNSNVNGGRDACQDIFFQQAGGYKTKNVCESINLHDNMTTAGGSGVWANDDKVQGLFHSYDEFNNFCQFIEAKAAACNLNPAAIASDTTNPCKKVTNITDCGTGVTKGVCKAINPY